MPHVTAWPPSATLRLIGAAAVPEKIGYVDHLEFDGPRAKRETLREYIPILIVNPPFSDISTKRTHHWHVPAGSLRTRKTQSLRHDHERSEHTLAIGGSTR